MEIRAEQIQAVFDGRAVLKEVSFRLEKEELVLLIGPNGSGKTTLMRILTGFQKPYGGGVFYDKLALNTIPVKRRSLLMAYMAQQTSRPLDDTVLDYVLLGAAPHLSLFKVPGKKERCRAEEILKEMRLWEKRLQRTGTLSQGEFQMADFARARMQETPWILLDEPLASLDFNRQHEFMIRLCRYQKRYGQGIFMSVHDPNICLNYGQRVMVLSHGRILGCVSKNETGFAQRLMGLLNQAYGEHLCYTQRDGDGYYYWKEEADVSGKELCEGREHKGSL